MSGHISDQIVVYKNDKVLVELRDKLKVASVANYAHILQPVNRLAMEPSVLPLSGS